MKNKTELNELFLALFLALMLIAVIFLETRKDFGQSGQLSVVVDGETPISHILVGGEKNAVIAKFRFFAKHEAFLVKQLRIIEGERQSAPCIEAVKINYPRHNGEQEEKVGVLGEKVFGAADFSNLNFYVPKNKPVILTVSVDLRRIVASGCSGSRVIASLAFDFFEAIGQESDERIIAHGNRKNDYFGPASSINALPMTIRKTKPTVISAAGSPAGVNVPKTNQEVLRFNISANQSGDLEVAELDFWINISDGITKHWSTIKNFQNKLALYNREDMTTALTGTWTLYAEDGTVDDGGDIRYAKFVFSKPQVVNAGVFQTFSLLMDTTGASRGNVLLPGAVIVLEIPNVTNIGGMMGLLKGIVWNETGVGAAKGVDGTNVQKLPVLGAPIIY